MFENLEDRHAFVEAKYGFIEIHILIILEV